MSEPSGFKSGGRIGAEAENEIAGQVAPGRVFFQHSRNCGRTLAQELIEARNEVAAIFGVPASMVTGQPWPVAVAARAADAALNKGLADWLASDWERNGEAVRIEALDCWALPFRRQSAKPR